QQLRHLLDLVDHDGAEPRLRQHDLAQALGVRRVLAQLIRLEQVDAQRVWVGPLRPERLAGAARTEQEEAPSGSLEESVDDLQLCVSFWKHVTQNARRAAPLIRTGRPKLLARS